MEIGTYPLVQANACHFVRAIVNIRVTRIDNKYGLEMTCTNALNTLMRKKLKYSV